MSALRLWCPVNKPPPPQEEQPTKKKGLLKDFFSPDFGIFELKKKRFYVLTHTHTHISH